MAYLSNEEVAELNKKCKFVVTDDKRVVGPQFVRELPENAVLIGQSYEDTPGYTSKDNFYDVDGVVYRMNVYFRSWSLD